MQDLAQVLNDVMRLACSLIAVFDDRLARRFDMQMMYGLCQELLALNGMEHKLVVHYRARRASNKVNGPVSERDHAIPGVLQHCAELHDSDVPLPGDSLLAGAPACCYDSIATSYPPSTVTPTPLLAVLNSICDVLVPFQCQTGLYKPCSRTTLRMERC